MAWTLLQVTLGAGATQCGAAIGANVPGSQVFCRQLYVQNNAAHVVRVGDPTVSASKGIALLNATTPPGGGSINLGPIAIYNTYLSDIWLFGTAADVIDLFYNT